MEYFAMLSRAFFVIRSKAEFFITWLLIIFVLNIFCIFLLGAISDSVIGLSEGTNGFLDTKNFEDILAKATSKQIFFLSIFSICYASIIQSVHSIACYYATVKYNGSFREEIIKSFIFFRTSFLRVSFALLLQNLLIFLGFICFVIPGILLLVKTAFIDIITLRNPSSNMKIILMKTAVSSNGYFIKILNIVVIFNVLLMLILEIHILQWAYPLILFLLFSIFKIMIMMLYMTNESSIVPRIFSTIYKFKKHDNDDNKAEDRD